MLRTEITIKIGENLISHPTSMVSPVCCQILVQGELDARWSGRLCGLTITTAFQENAVTVTQLSGRLADQAALFGVLNKLYQLRLPLISIIAFDDEVEKGGGCE